MKAALVPVIAAAALLGGCGGGDRDRLLKACIAGGVSTEAQCTCLADGAQRKLSSKGMKTFTDFVVSRDTNIFKLDRDLGVEESTKVGSLYEECRL